mmetsp:Transcript_25375/g.74963  ORF Transcript_25375/g.74963 Transcript_25375/m.74963 type:complete len:292 (-) Transcript_25375:152-1027(-)
MRVVYTPACMPAGAARRLAPHGSACAAVGSGGDNNVGASNWQSSRSDTDNGTRGARCPRGAPRLAAMAAAASSASASTCFQLAAGGRSALARGGGSAAAHGVVVARGEIDAPDGGAVSPSPSTMRSSAAGRSANAGSGACVHAEADAGRNAADASAPDVATGTGCGAKEGLGAPPLSERCGTMCAEASTPLLAHHWASVSAGVSPPCTCTSSSLPPSMESYVRPSPAWGLVSPAASSANALALLCSSLPDACGVPQRELPELLTAPPGICALGGGRKHARSHDMDGDFMTP